MKKLEIEICQLNLLLKELLVKLTHFSNPFGMTSISRLNLPSSCIKDVSHSSIGCGTQ